MLRSFAVGRNHTDVIGVVSPVISPLEEYNFQVCKRIINEVMVTGGTQPGLNNVAGGFYRDVNPGPYPFSTALGSDSGDHLDDSAFIVHPYLATTSVADSVDGIAGSDNLKSLWNEGLKNASTLAFETCCDGALFGFALPFSQNTSNAAGSPQLAEELRYYLAVSGMLNQTGELWYTACPYTNIPAEPRVNSNFPEEVAVLGTSGSVARGVALSAVGALLAAFL